MTLQPGQLCTINQVVYRACKRTKGCTGCSLNSLTMCPNIVDSRNGQRKVNCAMTNIILKKLIK